MSISGLASSSCSSGPCVCSADLSWPSSFVFTSSSFSGGIGRFSGLEASESPLNSKRFGSLSLSLCYILICICSLALLPSFGSLNLDFAFAAG